MITGFIARTITFLFLCSLLTFSASCSAVPQKAKSPKARLQTSESGTSFDLSGDAEEPARISEDQTRTETVLPKGSKVDVIPATNSEPGKVAITLAESSPLVSVSKSVHVDGPKSFSPPQPPSQTEIARGLALKWAYGLAGVLFVAGLTLLYLEHGKAGVIALIGAVIVPVAANLLTNLVALAIGGAFLLISLSFYACWHLMERRKSVFVAEQKTVESLRVQSS